MDFQTQAKQQSRQSEAIKPNKSLFAENLAFLMRKNKLSVKALTNTFNLAGKPTTEEAVYSWLNQKHVPQRSRIKILADLFHVTEEQLVCQSLKGKEEITIPSPKLVPSRDPKVNAYQLQERFLHLVSYIEKHHIVDYSVLIKTLMLEPENEDTKELERAAILQFPQQTIEFLHSKRSW